MRKNIVLFFLLSTFLFSACGARDSYEDGYSDGYDIGYNLGQQAAASIQEAPADTTVPVETTSVHSTPLPEPRNGSLFEEIPEKEAPASLSIRTSGTGGYYFVIDPVEFPAAGDGEFYRQQAQLQANNFYIRLYVRGGSTAEISLPLGEYAIYFAHGSNWYGEESLFGPETAYYHYDDTFLFRKTTKGYSAWTISSADAESIRESDFPKK